MIVPVQRCSVQTAPPYAQHRQPDKTFRNSQPDKTFHNGSLGRERTMAQMAAPPPAARRLPQRLRPPPH